MHSFDYMVVGAGSSGCALTNRVVADPADQVLLVEAVPKDTNSMIHKPMGFPLVPKDEKESWNYPPDPKIGMSEAFRVRGRVLGGSRSINGQIHMRGRPADYDGLTVPGWGWKEVGKTFEEVEDHELGPAEGRGTGGPLHIQIHPDKHPVCEALVPAVVGDGAVETPDGDQENGIAVGYLPRTVYKGRRQSAAVAFLKPILSAPNLTAATDTQANRVVFEGKRAVGIGVKDGTGTLEIQARKEIILSAGPMPDSIKGFGEFSAPADTLREHGISVVADAGQVGQNPVEQLGFIPQAGLPNHFAAPCF